MRRPSRNLFGVAETAPEVARDGIRLRQIGQQIIETLGGKRIHPAWVVPGGVSAPLDRRKTRPDPRPCCPMPWPRWNARSTASAAYFSAFRAKSKPSRISLRCFSA